MAHFPDTFLDEVLARTDVVELIARHVQLKKSGSSFMGLCPFHHEKSPSFSVVPDKQFYYCFGCGKGGGAFQFLMEHDGYSFPEAVEYLADKAGLEIPKDSSPAPQEEAKKKQALALLERVAGVFCKALYSEQGKPALAYLRNRGLSDDIIRQYKLGYAPPGYGFMQQSFGRDGRMLAQLETVGLLFKNERGYADRFRARVIFPIHDRRGHVVGFGGRLMEKGEPKYLNSPETPYYHKSDLLYGYHEHRESIRKRKLLVVVEGYMDVLALAAHGLPVGLASLGTAIGERQVREILRLHAEPAFCFDGDRAGRQAAWRALERMLPLLLAEHSPRFLYLPEGEDPDSLLQQEGAEAFSRRIEQEAKPVLDTWLAGLRNLAGKGVEGSARMAKKADAMLSSMQDDYLTQAWRKAAEDETGLTLKQQRKPVARAARGASTHTSPSARNQERFLAALLQMPTRICSLLQGEDRFILDDVTLNDVYTRALELAAAQVIPNERIVQTLLLDFPQEERIPLWASQSDISDGEYAKLLLLMQERHLKQLRKQPATLEQAARYLQRLQDITKKLKEVDKDAE